MEETEISAFAGMRMEIQLDDNMNLNAEVETRFSDQQRRTLSAKIGGKWRF
ncbi:MAG: hypothetical protein ACR2OW_04630 [Methyloligellaceae bacterium]